MASSAANLHGSITLHVPVIVSAIRLLLIAKVVVPSVVRQPAVFAVNGGRSIRVFGCSSIDNFKAALACIQRQPIARMFRCHHLRSPIHSQARQPFSDSLSHPSATPHLLCPFAVNHHRFVVRRRSPSATVSGHLTADNFEKEFGQDHDLVGSTMGSDSLQ
ncbi:hypothetical protein RHGRI_011643 [Rhododendron griersonianum]|uniref:Uncharacterized protein n=1 Tax=Rhododendron griersonianum TaxID=479676 RepID=A0AAV6KMN9_9ERIC|nr:hypothetical protein RHGRI_011643 [Rhododendron griersonianum]